MNESPFGEEEDSVKTQSHQANKIRGPESSSHVVVVKPSLSCVVQQQYKEESEYGFPLGDIESPESGVLLGPRKENRRRPGIRGVRERGPFRRSESSA